MWNSSQESTVWRKGGWECGVSHNDMVYPRIKTLAGWKLNSTLHTNLDTYDKLVFDDLKWNVIIAASMAYKASEEPELVNRERQVMSVVLMVPLSLCQLLDSRQEQVKDINRFLKDKKVE